MPAHRTWEDAERGGVTHVGGEGSGFGPQHRPVMRGPDAGWSRETGVKGITPHCQCLQRGKENFFSDM